MTTSVALCTYNGEKFLKMQIDSILNSKLKNLTRELFKTPYQKLREAIYQKYTLKYWVETAFELN